MMDTHTVRVKWQVDVEVPKGTTDWEIASQVAEQYFQTDIQAGERDSACVFDVGNTQIDLSEKTSPTLELAHAAQKVLEEFEGDYTGNLDRWPSVITLRRLIKAAGEEE